MSFDSLYATEGDDMEEARCQYCNVKSCRWKIGKLHFDQASVSWYCYMREIFEQVFLVDHEENLCMERRVPCINVEYGCDLILRR